MQGGWTFNNTQRQLYQKILEHIRKNQVVNPTIRQPISYLSHKFDQWLFAVQNTPHEKCTIVTEEFLNTIILESIDFHSFALVSEKLDADFQEQCNEQGILFLSGLRLQLIKHIAKQIRDSGVGAIPLSDIERLLNQNTPLPVRFNPADIDCYSDFVDSILNASNKEVLYEEAQKVLNIVAPLTPNILIMRGLAHAITKSIDPHSEVNHTEQLIIEAKTSILLHTTAGTQITRETQVQQANEAFAHEHPVQDRIIRAANYFNTYLSTTISWTYIGSVLSTFLTRMYAGYASSRAESDIHNALLRAHHNVTFNHTRIYQPDLNTNPNNTVGNNTVIYAPRHPSEQFPEHQGVLNGSPSYITTLMSTVQLTWTLPNMIFGQRKRTFILKHLKKYRPTQEEQRDDNRFLATVVFRWFGNVVIQPVDCVDSALKDAFFRWTIFRFFTPLAPIEEPLKMRGLYARLNRQCYRNQGRELVLSNRIMNSASLAILFFEYLDVSLGFPLPICSAMLKGTRIASVILPVLFNRLRGNITYNLRFRSFILANMLRTGSSPVVLTGFDLIGNSLRHVSLLTALDVMATVNIDAISSRILYEADVLEQHIMIIEDTVENIIVNNRGSLALLAPNMEIRFLDSRSQTTIRGILEEDEEEFQTRRRATREHNSTEIIYRLRGARRVLHQEVPGTMRDGIPLLSYRRRHSSSTIEEPIIGPEERAAYFYEQNILHPNRNIETRTQPGTHHVASKNLLNSDIYLEAQNPVILISHTRRSSVDISQEQPVVFVEQQESDVDDQPETPELRAAYFYQQNILHPRRNTETSIPPGVSPARAPTGMLNESIYLEEQEGERLTSYRRCSSITLTEEECELQQVIVEQQDPDRGPHPTDSDIINLRATYFYQQNILHPRRDTETSTTPGVYHVRAPVNMLNADIYLEEQNEGQLTSYTRHSGTTSSNQGRSRRSGRSALNEPLSDSQVRQAFFSQLHPRRRSGDPLQDIIPESMMQAEILLDPEEDPPLLFGRNIPTCSITEIITEESDTSTQQAAGATATPIGGADDDDTSPSSTLHVSSAIHHGAPLSR
ncbi:Cpg1 family polymorphic protein [Ehrlichia chaffeensis]|uniref:Cpg1 family polymorphic protein n=1 Tax=Ehrlichia chaffeensis TaxID=945 RepID=UPI000444C2EB|nr:hypothetical protein [Ehrlichia chaffeensis]AHX07491.1 hypothetical protein ECHOSC_0764 [Ehrlichia chaffeensis str. Osceola]